jgi:hypothetical protein
MVSSHAGMDVCLREEFDRGVRNNPKVGAWLRADKERHDRLLISKGEGYDQ